VSPIFDLESRKLANFARGPRLVRAGPSAISAKPHSHGGEISARTCGALEDPEGHDFASRNARWRSGFQGNFS